LTSRFICGSLRASLEIGEHQPTLNVPPSLSVEPARRKFGLTTRFVILDLLIFMRPVEYQQKIRARARFQQISRSTSAYPKIEPHLGIARGRRIRDGLQIFRGRSLDIHAFDRISVEKPCAQASAEPGRSATSAPAAPRRGFSSGRDR